MSQARYSLQTLHVPSPCTVSWRSMKGNEQERFCSQCQKSVYNLSAMSREQAESMLADQTGSPCVRFYYRADGTIVNAERCNNRVARTWRRITTTIGTMLVALMSLTGCDNCRFGCTQGKLATPASKPVPPPAEEHQPVKRAS